jgi:hypothetical protein
LTADRTTIAATASGRDDAPSVPASLSAYSEKVIATAAIAPVSMSSSRAHP